MPCFPLSVPIMTWLVHSPVLSMFSPVCCLYDVTLLACIYSLTLGQGSPHGLIPHPLSF